MTRGSDEVLRTATSRAPDSDIQHALDVHPVLPGLDRVLATLFQDVSCAHFSFSCLVSH